MQKRKSRLRTALAKRWVGSEKDFSIAVALEPYVSNRAILTYVLPLGLLGAVMGFIPPTNGWLVLVGLGAWYVGGFLIFVSLAVRWHLRASGLAIVNADLEDSAKRLANALADVHRRDPKYFEIVHWHESIRVYERGDAKIERRAKIRVGARPLNVYWSVLESYGSPIDRNLVRIEAYQSGKRGDFKLKFDSIWAERDGRLRSDIHVHPNRTIDPEEEIEIRIEWFWPGYMNHVIDANKPENFSYIFTRSCALFEIEIQLPRKKVFELNFSVNGTSTSITPTESGRKQKVAVAGLAPGARVVGVMQLVEGKR